ncbi:MAG: sialate O-acetylesterase, partial [Luteitalea sp.]
MTLLGLATTNQAQAPALPAKDAFHLFLLVGQSNMAGRGKVDAADTAARPSILMLDQARSWVPAVDPMHFDKPVAGVGLGRSFAARVLDVEHAVTVGLIPAAVGGSPIDAWQPGVFYEPTKSHPW